MSLRLYIIRHGETEWSLSGQHTGRSDIELNENGRAEARRLAERIRKITFSSVLVSPLMRAKETCDLAGLPGQAETEFDLIEWDNGEYEGKTAKDIRQSRPGWNVFRDGCPNGESPEQISNRVDRLIASLKKLQGNVALFTHGHLGRSLAARWIGQPVEFASCLLLDTASLSILCYHRDQPDQPAILLWNSPSIEIADDVGVERPRVRVEKSPSVQQPLENWENEGGEIPVHGVALSAIPTGTTGRTSKSGAI